MKTYKLYTLILAVLLAVLYTSVAAERQASPDVRAAVRKLGENQLFKAGEIQFDALYQIRTRDLRQASHGGGIRLAYFPWRAVGARLEGLTEKAESAVFDRVGLALVGRMPVDALRVAPEFSVGFDYDLEDSFERLEATRRTGFDVFVGIGGELRLTEKFGVFAEVRGVRPVEEGRPEHLRGLLGVRLSF